MSENNEVFVKSQSPLSSAIITHQWPVLKLEGEMRRYANGF